MEERTYVTHSAEETQNIARAIAGWLKGGAVLCLYGDLGAGKTTFTQGLAKAFGIHKRIISPTFIIARRYELKLKAQAQKVKFFHHLDLYRIKGENDLKGLGIEEILRDKSAIIVIEWAEKLGDLLPKKRIDIHFEHLEGDKRRITIKNYE